MTCQQCFSNNLKLENTYVSYDQDEKTELINEVYECGDCQTFRIIKRIG